MIHMISWLLKMIIILRNGPVLSISTYVKMLRDSNGLMFVQHPPTPPTPQSLSPPSSPPFFFNIYVIYCELGPVYG